MYQLLSNYKFRFNNYVGYQKEFVQAIVNEKISLDHIKCIQGQLNSQISFVKVAWQDELQ